MGCAGPPWGGGTSRNEAIYPSKVGAGFTGLAAAAILNASHQKNPSPPRSKKKSATEPAVAPAHGLAKPPQANLRGLATFEKLSKILRDRRQCQLKLPGVWEIARWRPLHGRQEN